MDIDRTRRVLIAADAWGHSMSDSLDKAARINVSNEPGVDDVEGVEAPGDLDTRGVLYAVANTRDVLNTVGGWLDSAQESLDISSQIDVLHGSQRDEGVGEGFQDPPAVAGGPIESNIQDGGGGGVGDGCGVGGGDVDGDGCGEIGRASCRERV